MFDFVKENLNLILPLATFLAGWILPVPLFLKLGESVSESIPPALAKILSDRLKAFERGLMMADFRGDTNLVDNDTVKNELKKVKLDLGLKE
ncbi:hypothetical protein PM10SUCC1_02810 [Propionigenium maris DSM 9537]|uniref:Uncharacterized protein n=1 Tax=Propionigenium maris DSM 9537 TaxID=1123000 RepID=A0A9W6LKZ1_9FUSO|nr:hypothetical protein [Propionigenium maris]GLI54766.1 hypothetical protein PM10SUCC1_02810 [Propionigenium maris DSM 9537]